MMFVPIKPAPPVIRIESRVIMGDMTDIICALCGEKQQVSVLYPATFKEEEISGKTYSARRTPDKIHYRIVRCSRCGLVFSSPILSPRKMSLLYRESACNYKDQIPYLIKTYYKIVEQIKNNLPENPKVMEVGCGNGFFLKALSDLNFTKNVFGIEPSSKMVMEADSDLQKNIKINIFKLGLFPKNSFDLILCFHTLDHMFDPNEFIRGAHMMLKKNGYAIAVVHDTEGLSVKLFGEKSAIFDVEHIYLFNKDTLRNIFEHNHFEVIKVFDLTNNYPLNYWMRMSGLPNFVKKSVSSAFNLFGVGEKAVSIPAGNIAIIAKKN
jgi:SAM-dependent methyltransferase